MSKEKQLLLKKSIRRNDENVKANVYFICHPDDFDMYYDTLSNDIGTIHSCDIYYLNPELGDIRSDKQLMQLHEDNILEMQLIVVPITERFLSEPSFSKDIDLPLAIKCKKPVLPIMLGYNLLETYNKNDNLHKMHYFNKASNDSTGLTYEEKLKRYLDSILLNDEQYKRIKKEFSDHIFLSYRKVDRFYAREFMSLIHNMEEYRDVSIWYDEFLTPGEHYNDEILGRIKESDLFALIVTPNVTIRPNYIEEHEYRDAKKCGRDIVAAECLCTNRQTLEDVFSEFPECIKADNVTTVQETLKKYGIGASEKKNDAMHLYFMGLAYLNGVEVEVDSNRAVSLFADAANQNSSEGSPQAMKQLSNMYYNGTGVARDYLAAKEWQIKLTDFLENRLKNLSDINPSDSEIDSLIISYIVEYMTLGDYCYEENDEDGAETYYERITKQIYGLTTGEFCLMENVFNPNFLTPKVANGIWSDATRGATRLAKINYFNDYRDYTDLYNNMEREIEAVLNKHRNNTLYGAFQKEMADMDIEGVSEEDVDMAGAFLKEMDDLLAKQIDNESLYKMESAHKNFDKAIKYLLENVEIFERLIEIAEAMKDENAIESSKKANIGWYSRAGNCAFANRSYEEAIEYIEKSLKIYEELGGNLDMFQSADEKLDIWVDYLDLGQCYCFIPNQDLAIKYLRKAYEVCEEIYEKTPNAHWKENLQKTKLRLDRQEKLMNGWNKFYSMLGVDTSQDNDSINASQNNVSNNSVQEKFTEEAAEKLSTEELHDIAHENMSKGDKCLTERNYDEAKEYYEKTMIASMVVFKRTKKIGDLWNYSFSCEGLGTVAMRQQRFEDCIEYYSEVADKCSIIIRTVDLEKASESLGLAYDNLGMASSKAGHPRREVKKYFDLAEDAWKAAYKKYGRPEYLQKKNQVKNLRNVFK